MRRQTNLIGKFFVERNLMMVMVPFLSPSLSRVRDTLQHNMHTIKQGKEESLHVSIIDRSQRHCQTYIVLRRLSSDDAGAQKYDSPAVFPQLTMKTCLPGSVPACFLAWSPQR